MYKTFINIETHPNNDIRDYHIRVKNLSSEIISLISSIYGVISVKYHNTDYYLCVKKVKYLIGLKSNQKF